MKLGSRWGGRRIEKERWGQRRKGGRKREGKGGKLAKLPICTQEVQISSGTIFLCNTSHHNVAKRHDTAWHHHTTLPAQHRPFSHIYMCVCVCVWMSYVWCVYCRYWGSCGGDSDIVLLDGSPVKWWAHRHQIHLCAMLTVPVMLVSILLSDSKPVTLTQVKMATFS